MKRIAMISVLSLSIGLGTWMFTTNMNAPLAPAPALADVTAAGDELSVYMGRLQRHTHKLGLSIDAGNKDLAAFYAIELGETAADIQKKFKAEYAGFQIGVLLGAMLTPTIPPVAQAISGGDMAGASTKYNLVVASCNNCHVATQRAHVKITRSKSNPYNQDFSK